LTQVRNLNRSKLAAPTRFNKVTHSTSHQVATPTPQEIALLHHSKMGFCTMSDSFCLERLIKV